MELCTIPKTYFDLGSILSKTLCVSKRQVVASMSCLSKSKHLFAQAFLVRHEPFRSQARRYQEPCFAFLGPLTYDSWYEQKDVEGCGIENSEKKRKNTIELALGACSYVKICFVLCNIRRFYWLNSPLSKKKERERGKSICIVCIDHTLRTIVLLH